MTKFKTVSCRHFGNMDLLLKFFVLSLTLIGFCEPYGKVSESLKVTLSHGGGVIGSYQTSLKGRGIRAFKGIPYAEPPVGDLRFSDPVEKSGWTGFIKGKGDLIMCPQYDIFVTHTYMGQEDCLYLSVYAPQFPEKTGLLPVMVYVHGGGYSGGFSGMFQPDFFLDYDIILVVVNYRLGPLGFMSTFTEEMRGNYGIKDQIETLKWVKKNIEIFGGDPTNVTVFGASAGGSSVSHLLATPLAKGLFQRVIVQSGTMYEAWGTIGKGLAEKNTKKLFPLVGCPYIDDNVTQAIACMKTKTAQEIVEQTNKFAQWDIHPMFSFGPVIESRDSKNALLTQENYDLGADPTIPIMIGITPNEGAMMLPLISRTEEVLKDFKDNYEKILPLLAWYYDFEEDKKVERTKQLVDFYFDGKRFNWDADHQALSDMMSDSWFLQGLLKLLEKRFKHNHNNTFVYLYNYSGDLTMTDFLGTSKEDIDYGISHGNDMSNLSPIYKVYAPHLAPSQRDEQFRDIMTKIWIDFAVLGHHADNLNWRPANKFPVDYLRLGEKDKGIGIGMETGLFTKRSEFWKRINQ